MVTGRRSGWEGLADADVWSAAEGRDMLSSSDKLRF